jgi:hypothetical protein
MNDIGKYEGLIAELTRKREACVQRGADLSDERAAVALAAHTGDAKAAKRLTEIHAALAVHSSELESLDAAAKTANGKLAAVRQAEAQAQDKAAARQMRDLADSITRRLVHADEFFAAAVEQLNAANAELRAIHALGEAYPSEPQFRLGMIPALQTMIMGLPASWWRDWSRFVPPLERRRFAQFWARQHGPLEGRIRQRLGEGEQTKTEHAA